MYCGSNSHMKLMRLPIILQPEVILKEECMDMYRHPAYIYEGSTLKIDLKMVQIPMIIQGLVQANEYNINCQGAKFVIEDEEHYNMLLYRTVRLSMVDISIQVSKHEVQELRDLTILDPSFITDMKCIVGIIPTSS